MVRPLAVALCVCLAAGNPSRVFAQSGAHDITRGVYGFGTTVRVLMIGAHPDDEDTALLAWLALGRQVETAYLSLTRGDGGQNLIGNELGEALGAIRTEELLAARRIDGARQYFTRAFDFGFSKDSAETFTHWPRDTILGDVIRVVRAFRPHVIIGVFTGTAADGHGHHTVSGILAREAFDVADDTARFVPDRHGSAWTPLKFYRARRGNAEGSTLRQNVGEFDPVLGRGLGEVAGESRSQHKSQGFGGAQQRGVVWNHVRREATRVNESTPAGQESSMFDGIDTSWTRVRAAARTPAQRAAVDSVPVLARAAREQLDLRAPSGVVPLLARAAALLDRAVADSPCRWAASRVACEVGEADLATSIDVARQRVVNALIASAGVQIDAAVDREYLASGDTARATITVHNRGPQPVTVRRVVVSGATMRWPDTVVTIASDSMAVLAVDIRGLPPGGAWWLAPERRRTGDHFPNVYSPADGAMGRAPGASEGLATWGVAVAEDSRTSSWVDLVLEIAGERFTHRTGPLEFRRIDPVAGEVRRPLVPVPALSLVFDRALELMRADQPIDRVIRLQVRSLSTRPRPVQFEFTIPPGVTADGLIDTLTLGAMETRVIPIRLRGRVPEGRHALTALARGTDGALYTSGFFTVEYQHIRPITLFRSSGVWVKGVRVALPTDLRVAYVTGVSDDVGPVLRQLDIPVELVDPTDFGALDLRRFNAVVLGPRVYQRAPELAEFAPQLEQFARDGNTVVVQYGQQEMQRPGVLPFPIELAQRAERVTLEDAEVRFVDDRLPVLSRPNRITAADFVDWIQERALYLPSRADSAWTTVVEMNDPGEPPNRNGILVARIGNGAYVYTTLSFFRQLPEGTDGAIRLFVNLLSATRPVTSQ